MQCKKDLYRADNVNYIEARTWVYSSRVRNSKKVRFSLARNADSELALRMSFRSDVQTFGAAIHYARLAVD